MSARPFIESTLADAEAELAGLVVRKAPDDELETARAYCRNAQQALRELNMREGKPRDYRKKADVTFLPILELVRKQTSREAPVKSATKAGKGGWEIKQLKWQAVQAFSLLLAYLQYYFV